MTYVPPREYVCYRTRLPITVDGKLDEPAWQQAPWTEYFVDIEGDVRPAPRFRTRVKMLWDARCFYVAAELEEPHVWGTLSQHDSVIFQDNDFELFVDPDGDNHQYFEFEINALNTSWDLFLPKPYRDSGRADNDWDIPGLKTGVHVDGTVNEPGDVDQGWSVEIALPWKALEDRAGCPAPPRDGDQWRVNFSRVEWVHELVGGKYRKVGGRKEDNWVWSPQGVVDMHRPERWGYVQFSTARPGTGVFRRDPTGPARDLLMRVYQAQQKFHTQRKRWAGSLDELGLDGLTDPALAGPVALRLTDGGFEATATVPAGRRERRVHVRQDSRLWEG